MNAQDGVVLKKCLNKFCHQSDWTDFSTCRYCGARYDGKTERYIDKPGPMASMLSNPMPVVVALGVVASIFCTVYMASLSPSTARYHSGRRGAALSIPAAFIYYFGNKMATNAQKTEEFSSEILKHDPTNYRALVDRADAHYTRLEMGEAMRDYSSAINAHPELKEAYEKRAIIYDANGNYDASAKDRVTAASLSH